MSCRSLMDFSTGLPTFRLQFLFFTKLTLNAALPAWTPSIPPEPAVKWLQCSHNIDTAQRTRSSSMQPIVSHFRVLMRDLGELAFVDAARDWWCVLTAACLCLLVTRQNERAGERRVYVGGELCRRLLMSDVFICHDDLDAAGAPCALSSSPPIETSLTWAWRNVIVLRLKVSRASRPEVGWDIWLCDAIWFLCGYWNRLGIFALEFKPC